MKIDGTGHIHAAQQINAPHRIAASKANPQTESLTTVDQLDISHEAELASRVDDLPELRNDKIAAIRSQIEAGTYETDDKLDMAVSRLLDEIG